MIRIFLPLVMAVVAFFGPWSSAPGAVMNGFDFARPTVECFVDLNPSFAGPCAPTGTLAERLVTYTVIGGGFAGILSIIGLLPLIGRLTSLVVMAAGGLGAAAAITTAVSALGGEGIAVVGWGAWGALAAGLATVFAGLMGVRDGND